MSLSECPLGHLWRVDVFQILDVCSLQVVDTDILNQAPAEWDKIQGR